MTSIKRVIDYLNIDYYKALDLATDVFLLALKNSYVSEWKKTKEGREYLEKCKRLNTTSLDVTAFKKLKGEIS